MQKEERERESGREKVNFEDWLWLNFGSLYEHSAKKQQWIDYKNKVVSLTYIQRVWSIIKVGKGE